ncbi:MAG: chromosomal replication initiator protein DnaA [Candidatus Hydrogenedens sp.]|nr:chromosomal replication initiator protein DnaA [Candidatus Hydrogenedens sp.]
MNGTTQNPWEQIQHSLESVLDEYTYKNWFAKTVFDSFEDNILRVRVPNLFFANWIKEYYHDKVMSTARELFPELSGVNYIEGIVDSPRKAGPMPVPISGTPRAQSRKTVVRTRRPGANFNPRYTFERFVIGAGNRFAHAAARAVLDSPGQAYNPLFLCGGTGLGKTHLMQAIGQGVLHTNPSLRVVFISSEQFTNEMIQSIADKNTQRFRDKYRRVDLLLIDDIHFLSGKEATQEEFFHTFNALYNDHKQIVISSDRPPRDLERMEERLVSRFESGLITDIQAPDLETRIAILQNKAKQDKFDVPDDILRFIATYITSNIRELEGALLTLFAYSRLADNKVTQDMAESVLHNLIDEGRVKPVTPEQVQRAVAEHFDVRISDLRGPSRQRQVAWPRQLAMYLCKTLIPGMSLSTVGENFGGRDHTTVLYACNRIEKSAAEDSAVRQELDQLTRQLRS